MASITTSTAGLVTGTSDRLLGDKPDANLFVVVQCGGGDEDLVQALPVPISHIVVCYNDVVQVGQIIPPT